ncbi:MAG: type IV pilus assembly protein PilM [Candidatus Omnitrophica bacterium]|nr:type IV pilus assembly protein PilM [Candidatus Omnitrophota bacterium]
MPSPLTVPPLLQTTWRALRRLVAIKPKEAKLTIGLDVGSSSVKAVALGSHKALGGRRVLGQQCVEIPPGSPSQEAQIPQAIQQALHGLPVSHLKGVAVAVSGQWVIMRVVEMPALTPAEFRQALPYEAQRSLPFNVQDVVLDGVILGSSGSKMWALMVACKRDFLDRRLGWVKQAGFEVTAVDVDALALTNAFLEHANGTGPSETPALVNLGAQWTNLVVLKNGLPYLVRDIPWGAEKLIRHVADQLGLDPADAASQLKQSALPNPQALEALASGCEALIEELQLSFDFFESHFGPSPSHLVLSGGLSQSGGLLEALKKHLTQPVTPWPFAQRVSNQFAIAYGLALRT